MQRLSQEPIIIDLDDPAPRWFRCCGVLAAVLVIALMIAPWVIDDGAQGSTTPEGATRQIESAGYTSVCQPTVDFPTFAEPAISMALPSWMRLCDWFADPVQQPGVIPTQPPIGPHFQD